MEQTYDYVIAIPTYKRYKQLRDKTLTFLQREGFDPNNIYVFVASEEEKQKYEETIQPNTCRPLIVGRLGLAPQLNFIYDYFPVGQKIIRIDDDIDDILFLEKRPVKEMIKRMWEIAEEEGVTYWSIYPVANKYFCTERIVIGLVMVVGCFNAFINTRAYIPEDLSAAEDRWMTLSRYLKDGKTMRYEGCCPKTRYTCKGGLEEYRKTGTNQYDDTERVAKMFPNLCKLKQYKKNGMWDAVIPLKYTHTRQLMD